jgi:hypothetical protein
MRCSGGCVVLFCATYKVASSPKSNTDCCWQQRSPLMIMNKNVYDIPQQDTSKSKKTVLTQQINVGKADCSKQQCQKTPQLLGA